jgi:Two component regulator propeller
MKTSFFILFPCLFNYTISFSAQDLPAAIPLNNNMMITAIGESDHYVWVGTNEGLFKINKKNGKRSHFTNQNSRLPHNYVTSIACARDGKTYIGTINGILMWDNYAFLVISTENSSFPSDIITALAIDRDDHLWIGTYGDGLIKSTGEDIKPFRTQPIEFNDENIYSIAFDPQGNVWVEFFNSRMACLRNGKWDTYASIHDMDTIVPGVAGRFIVNSPDQGTYLCNNSSFKNVRIDSLCRENTYGYFNFKYSRFVVCYKDEVDVLDLNNPLNDPLKFSIYEFLESLSTNIPVVKRKTTYSPSIGDPNSSLLLLLMAK